MALQPSPSFQTPRTLIDLGGTLTTLPELYEWHARHNPAHPLFRYTSEGCTVKEIPYAHMFRAIRRASRYVRSQVTVVAEGGLPVAILANADAITYCCTSVGIMHAGHIPFHISPRNGAAAIAGLLRRAHCRVVLVSPDIRASILAQELVRELEDIELLPVPHSSELFAHGGGMDGDEDEGAGGGSRRQGDGGLRDSAIILHSAGSTSDPKPIYWSHKQLLKHTTAPWHGQVDITNKTFGIHALPMYSAMGICICCAAICNGAILGVFEPSAPPTAPTPDNVFAGTRTAGCDYVYLPAGSRPTMTFVETWARDAEKVAYLKRMRGLMVGGGPLAQDVGEALAYQDVNVLTVYGCAEVGTISTFVAEKMGIDWAYFRFSPWIDTVQVDQGDGTYEVVVLSTDDCPLSVLNTNIGTQGAYATGDLVVRHPTEPDLWRLYGRKDDQIVLASGEKTNPGPIERMINEDPHVASSILFGEGRMRIGVLVEPDCDSHVVPGDRTSLINYRKKIWSAIERANRAAPRHSRICIEMILVALSDKPLEYSGEGGPRRAPNIARYCDEINALYAEAERDMQTRGSAVALSLY